MGRETLEAIHGRLDFLEVFNARMVFSHDNQLAQELAASWGLPGSAGNGPASNRTRKRPAPSWAWPSARRWG